MKQSIIGLLALIGMGCSGSSPVAPTGVGPPLETRIPADCVTVVSKSFEGTVINNRTDYVTVRYVLENTCDRRLRFHGEGGRESQFLLEIYDNPSLSGSPLDRMFVRPFEIAPHTRTTMEESSFLNRGEVSDIPSADAIVMFPVVNWATS
jgi:hypothetical protein